MQFCGRNTEFNVTNAPDINGQSSDSPAALARQRLPKLWIGYLLEDQQQLAWAAVAALGTVAVLGLIMAARWIGVYRTVVDPGPSLTRSTTVPPERNFPLPVVVVHGILAVTTLVLVLFTALGVGPR